MTEQTTAEMVKKAAEERAKSGEPREPAPIDKRAPKPRAPSSLPKAMRPTAGMDPRLFDSVKEFMGENPVGAELHASTMIALQSAADAMTAIADAEDQIIDNHNKAIKAGTATGHVQMINGRPTAIPSRLEELADAADTKLAAAIDKHDAKMKGHETKMLGLVHLMEKATHHAETANDKQLMAQVRSHLTSLGKGAKLFAIKAANNGDRALIHTVLNSPPYLSGLNHDDVQEVRKAAEKALTPELVKYLEIGHRMRDALTVAEKALVKKRKSLAGYRHEGERLATEALNKLRTG